MKVKNWLISLTIIVVGLIASICSVNAARVDMIDVSNHNGVVDTNTLVALRNQGLKAVTCKISEGTFFIDGDASTDIANAERAKLYVNGYFFVHYSNIQQAINEARFAVQTAKQDGLPVESALVADIESSEQRNLTTSQNDACIQAMAKVIQAGGYRFAVYSMASWGDYIVPWSDIKWIAMYPYHVSRDLYTHGYAWQWTDNYHFNGYTFDASQLYTNFFTGNLNRNAVISNAQTKKVNISSAKTHNNMSSTQGMIKAPKQEITENYTQRGIFIPNCNLNIRTAPNTHSFIVGNYSAGEKIYYNHVFIKNNYVWCRYLGSSGYYRYVCMGILGGQSYGTRIVSTTHMYIVQNGDTLYEIANKLDVSVHTLINMNSLSNPNCIYVGQSLLY